MGEWMEALADKVHKQEEHIQPQHCYISHNHPYISSSDTLGGTISISTDLTLTVAYMVMLSEGEAQELSSQQSTSTPRSSVFSSRSAANVFLNSTRRFGQQQLSGPAASYIHKSTCTSLGERVFPAGAKIPSSRANQIAALSLTQQITVRAKTR